MQGYVGGLHAGICDPCAPEAAFRGEASGGTSVFRWFLSSNTVQRRMTIALPNSLVG